MIYLLYGPDTFRARAKLLGIRDKFLASQPSFNFIHINGSEINSADGLLRLLGSATLLGGKRLVVITDLMGLGEAAVKDSLVAAVRGGLPDDLVVVLQENFDFDKRQSLFKLLNQPKTAQFFGILAGTELFRYAKELAEAKKFDIDDGLLREVIVIVGGDLWRLDNELTKLASYAKTTPLSVGVIRELISADLEDNIFALMDAVANHNSAAVNRLFGDLMDRGEDPARLLPVLAFQLRNLILLKNLSTQRLSTGELIRITGLHPYAVSNTLKQIRLFTADQLNNAYQRLIATDWQIKTGALDPADALDQMLVSFAS